MGKKGFAILTLSAILLLNVGCGDSSNNYLSEQKDGNSPALETVIKVTQSAFRGYKPGNKELRQKLRDLNKSASPDEIESIMAGNVDDWIVVDIRNETQRNGGHIVVDGKRMIEVGRLKPTSMMETSIMEIVDNKEIITPAPKNIVIVCRSGMKSAFDYGSYAMAGFNDVKIGSILEWIKSCRPLTTSTDILDAGVKGKGYPMEQASDGQYYWTECNK